MTPVAVRRNRAECDTFYEGLVPEGPCMAHDTLSDHPEMNAKKFAKAIDKMLSKFPRQMALIARGNAGSRRLRGAGPLSRHGLHRSRPMRIPKLHFGRVESAIRSLGKGNLKWRIIAK